MAKSRSLGITSYHKEVVLDKALEHLTNISLSKVIQKIDSSLNPDSKLHIVGGTVRDSLLNIDNCDFDLATVLPPQEVIRRLESHKIRVIETGITHGTVTALVDDIPLEITTFRKPGKREKSEFSASIETDLSGRDFTINAIAFDVKDKKIIDPFNGVSDLQNNLIKCVGDPNMRFTEDPLRVMRLMRLGPAQGREIDKETQNAALAISKSITKVSIERVRSELELILISEYPANTLRLMAQFGILELIIPELMPSIGFEQNDFHTQDVFEHILTVVQNSPSELRLRLAALFHDIGKPESLSVDENGRRHFYLHEEIGFHKTKTIMKRLKFSNDEIHAVSELVRLHMRPMDCGPAGVRRLLRDLGDYFEDWKKLKTADAPPVMSEQEYNERFGKFESMVASEKERLSKIGKKLLTISGEDLIAIGVKPGPGMGKILKTLENMVLDNPDINNKEKLLEIASSLKE
jgi:tRNA nucleotidyltransferase (CCA-adding enzyme)